MNAKRGYIENNRNSQSEESHPVTDPLGGKTEEIQEKKTGEVRIKTIKYNKLILYMY